MRARDHLHKFMRRFGIEAHKVNPFTVPEWRIPQILNRHGIRTLLDVGANEGIYAMELLENGFAGSILSFEPLPDVWEYLKRRASQANAPWKIAPRIALSNQTGESEFTVAGNKVSSSNLMMNARKHGFSPKRGKTASDGESRSNLGLFAHSSTAIVQGARNQIYLSQD